RSADENGDPPGCVRDLVDRAPCGPDEPRPEQEVLGWIAGDRELGKEDEVGACLAGLVQPGKDLAAIAVEVADDRVHLCECESHRPGEVFSSRSKTLPEARLRRRFRVALSAAGG